MSKALSTSALFFSSSSLAIPCFLHSLIIESRADSFSSSRSLNPQEGNRNSMSDRPKSEFKSSRVSGPPDLLMIVVVLVDHASSLPSANGVPLQSAPFASHAGDCRASMRNASRWQYLEAPQSAELIQISRQLQPLHGAARENLPERIALSLFHESSPAIPRCSPRRHRRKISQRFPETLRSSYRFPRAGSLRSGLAPRPASWCRHHLKPVEGDERLFDHRSPHLGLGRSSPIRLYERHVPGISRV